MVGSHEFLRSAAEQCRRAVAEASPDCCLTGRLMELVEKIELMAIQQGDSRTQKPGSNGARLRNSA
jgi:hypothetical protein